MEYYEQLNFTGKGDVEEAEETAIKLIREFEEAYITGLQNYRLERFATELSKKLCEFLDENEDNAGKIDKAIFLIDVIGVVVKDGTVISKGIINKVMEEFTK